MSILYLQWYKQFGIRMASQLMSPPLPKLELLNLPRQSILHFIAESLTENGPASDEFLFRNIKRPIMTGHVVEIGDTKGNPRHLAVSADAMIRTYHIKHRRFKLMRSLDASSRDVNTLIVYNYGLIPSLYRYIRNYYTEYYKWWNIQSAVWKKIANIAEENDRNQFIVCKLPLILPSVPDLSLATKTVSQKTIKIFNNPESLELLELWKWFGEDRKESVISNVSEKQLDKINIIFQESGCWFVMNLGRMNRWRKATAEELEINPEANTKGIEPKQLQRRFLRLMMSLFQTRTVPIDVVVDAKAEDDNVVVVKQDPVIPTTNNSTGTISNTSTEVSVPVSSTGTNVKQDETISHDDNIEKQLEADLSELENISIKHVGNLDDEGNDVPEEIAIKEVKTLEDGVMDVCDKLADNGLLSAAEYRRYLTLAGTYKTIIAPNGVETLDKFMVVTPEKLAIESSFEITDIKAVTDKTMLKSSLHSFDSKYIKEVLPRDIAGMVLNVQKAGIAVTGYETETIDSILGSYIIYTVKVKPVEGLPSTLRFKLPVLDEDGVYVSNGTKYRMRKQRGDKSTYRTL